MKCGETIVNEQTCSGFLEEWIDQSNGVFGHVRDHISANTLDTLIQKIRQFTQPDKIKTTIYDLDKIIKYMEMAPSQNAFRQICDLQGFFLKTGGFLVNDTPEIQEKIQKDAVCWSNEPTTEEVLDGLKIIKAINLGENGGS